MHSRWYIIMKDFCSIYLPLAFFKIFDLFKSFLDISAKMIIHLALLLTTGVIILNAYSLWTDKTLVGEDILTKFKMLITSHENILMLMVIIACMFIISYMSKLKFDELMAIKNARDQVIIKETDRNKNIFLDKIPH